MAMEFSGFPSFRDVSGLRLNGGGAASVEPRIARNVLHLFLSAAVCGNKHRIRCSNRSAEVTMVDRNERRPYWRHTKMQMLTSLLPFILAMLVLPLYADALKITSAFWACRSATSSLVMGSSSSLASR